MIVLLIVFVGILNCYSGFSQEKITSKAAEKGNYILAGEEFSAQNILSAYQMQEKYRTLKPGDSLNITFMGEVNEVCQNKGCWMKLNLENGEEVMVKFKDYSFFVPKDIQNKTVIVKGMAYVSELSVEEQRHYAEDAGKSADEINKINSPQKTLSFEAEGVKIIK
ncbi:DUF4920 domain-containing protein [Salinimicrobium soli]|uniref:DUF4920 domain-containing protein n=1 Tax=Salinimicrobium soli TaxID=1254399 RepID=UPI003AADDB31